MSWRRKDNNKYNRSEEVEYWLTLIEEEVYWHCPWQHDWDDDYTWEHPWWDYYGGGAVNSMNEYHQMKVLTLLRKLNVKTATVVIKERGW